MVDNGTHDVVETAAEADPLPALPMQKDSDPEWAKTEAPAEPALATDPKQAVPMQKPAPKWAQTLPAPPGEPLEQTELPATTSKRSWPPADGPQNPPDRATDRPTGAPIEEVAPEQGAIPEETDVWPAEPPTEHTMPAWPPSSTISKGISESSPGSTSEPISSWPDTFDSSPQVTKPRPETKPAATVPPASTAPPASTVPPAATVSPAPTLPPAATTPPEPIAPTVPPASTAPPEPIAPTVPPAATAPPEPIAPTVPPAATAPSGPVAPTVPPAAAPAVPTEPRPTVPPAQPVVPAAAAPAPAPAASTPPASAPSAPAAPQQSGDPAVDWPDAVPIPSWAPQIHVTTEHRAPAQPAPQPAPAPPAAQPQPAPQPTASQPPAQPPPSRPPSAPPSQPPSAPPFAVPASVAQPGSSPGAQQPGGTANRSSWEVVEQRQKVDPKKVVPTPEDRSYAEWFAWAKRGGAPAGACHAAAQGAFQALSSGKDVATAVQWATAAMTRPPVPVSADRQSYCAWFSLAHIDLNLDQHKAHAFATAAVHALDAGADAASAHAAGLHAAGIK